MSYPESSDPRQIHLVAKSETLRAGAKGIVKGKASRLYLTNTDAAVRAGKTLGKLDLLSTDHIHGHQSVRQFQYIFNGIHQTFFNAFLYYQTVYYNLDIVLLFLSRLISSVSSYTLPSICTRT